FPRLFEFEAVASYPDEVEKLLQATDIGSYSWFAGRSTIVPKGELSFRSATQLDPWDSLILTALIREFGDTIEKKRIPYSAGVPLEAAKSINRLLGNLTQGVSCGIPVGPHATHLLAECVFDPIDKNLLTEGYAFCRFVDDIHIFCKTRQQAQI